MAAKSAASETIRLRSAMMFSILGLVAIISGLIPSALSSCVAGSESNTTLPWASWAITAPLGGRYLHRTKSGDPSMWVADTNWELFHRMNVTDVDLFLADRAAKGFNVIQVVVASKYNATTLPNYYGDLVTPRMS